VRKTGGAHAGDLPELAQQIAQQSVAWSGVIAGFACIDADEQEMFGGKAEVRALQVIKRSRQQTGADQQR